MVNWGTITIEVLQNLWQVFLFYLPRIVGAIIIFAIGWFISVGVGRLIAGILRKLKFNKLFERGVWRGALEKAEIKVDASGFIGAIFKWILVIVFLLAAVEILGFVQFAGVLKSILGYLPNVIVAAFIFGVAAIVADILEKTARAAVESTKIGYGGVVGAIVKWAIWIFAILAILVQLRVAPELIRILFAGFVALITVAGGIAFGLGGKEIAAETLRELRKKLRGE